MPENSGENREYSGEQDSRENMPKLKRKESEVRDTRGGFLSNFNTFHRN